MHGRRVAASCTVDYGPCPGRAPGRHVSVRGRVVSCVLVLPRRERDTAGCVGSETGPLLEVDAEGDHEIVVEGHRLARALTV